MMPLSDLSAVFLVGLLGSLHCVGMCGGFVVMLAHTAPPGRLYQRQVYYVLGKTATYALLGAAMGGLGRLLPLAGLQHGLSLLAGLALLLIGWNLLGRRAPRWLPGTQLLTRLAGFLGTLLRRRHPTTPLLLGLANGFLPCGLVYGMLLLAVATGSATQGTLMMTVFGLATIPALLLLTLTPALVRAPRWRAHLRQAGGVLLLLLGLLTLLRGTPVLDAMLPHGMHTFTMEHPP